MKIFIGNLAFKTTAEELKKIFDEFGTVLSVDIAEDSDGNSRGFGFVEMSEDADAHAAITGLEGKEIEGRVVNVSPALIKPKIIRRGEGRRSRNYMKRQQEQAPIPEEPREYRRERPGFRNERHGFRKERPGFRGERQGFRGERQGFREERGGFRKARHEFRAERPESRGEHQGPREERREFQGERREFRGERREFQGERREFHGGGREFRGERREFQGGRREFQGDRREFRGERRDERRDERAQFPPRRKSHLTHHRGDSPVWVHRVKKTAKPWRKDGEERREGGAASPKSKPWHNRKKHGQPFYKKFAKRGRRK